MTPREVAHRFKEQSTLARLRAEHGHVRPPDSSALRFLGGPGRRLPDLSWSQPQPQLQEQSNQLLECFWPALGFDWQWSDDPLAWRRAPDTGRIWPATFAFGIDYRPGNPVGDVRVAWEPARLQQLVSLALLSGDQEYGAQALDLLERQFLSWVEHNPPWSGIHYLSSMECALRLVAVCHAVDLVRDRLTRPKEMERALIGLVSSHADLISRRLSLYSSAGNHTIAEGTGLVYAGVLFPEFARARQWRDVGLKLLEDEMQRQVLDDGGGLEQAFWYLLFITDLASLSIGLLKHHGQSVPARLDDRVSRATGFLRSFGSAHGDLPSIGDSDDGFALCPKLRLSLDDVKVYASTKVFEQSGYTLARSSDDVGVEVVFDHGPMGMAPSYGHAHADALSIVLRRHGQDVLIDPGTGTYGGDPRLRRYFRSTPAHNTLTVDARDQAVQESAFQWSSPVNAKLVRSEIGSSAFRGLALHEGYRERMGGLLLWRGIVLTHDGKLLIWDCIDGGGVHQLDWHWHCTPDARGQGQAWQLAADMRLELPAGVDGTAVAGGTEPFTGWRSRRYGQTEPTVTIRASTQIDGAAEFLTRVFPADNAWSPAVVAQEVAQLRQWMSQA